MNEHYSVRCSSKFYHSYPVPDPDVTFQPALHACTPSDPATRTKPNPNLCINSNEPHNFISLKVQQNDHIDKDVE